MFLTRFFPIIRTIAPFVAGMGEMHFGRFTLFNIIGGSVWVSLFSLLGYFFGGVPFVEQHFELVIVGIVVISLVPAVAGGIKAKLASGKKKAAAADEGAVDETTAWAPGEAAADARGQGPRGPQPEAAGALVTETPVHREKG